MLIDLPVLIILYVYNGNATVHVTDDWTYYSFILCCLLTKQIWMKNNQWPMKSRCPTLGKISYALAEINFEITKSEITF